MKKAILKFGIIALSIITTVSCSNDDDMSTTPANNNVSITAGENFTDSRDGTVYPTVKINDQIWMTKNLSFNVNGQSFAYNNDEANVTMYGRLYTWASLQQAIPSGWHLPTDAEWQTLEKALGMSDADLTKNGYDVARGAGIGTRLKVNGDSMLNIPIAGFAEVQGSNVSFDALENRTYLWINTTTNGEVFRRRIPKAETNVYRFANPSDGFAISVRLIKD